MTDKIINRVAQAIENKAYNAGYSKPFRQSTDFAKAAIEALDIIILPADAEPQVGDLVHDLEKDAYGIVCALYHKEGSVHSLDYKDHVYIFDYQLQYSGGVRYQQTCRPKNCKIIQRDGKPVIQEGKDD